MKTAILILMLVATVGLGQTQRDFLYSGGAGNGAGLTNMHHAGDVVLFGADPTGVADSTAAFVSAAQTSNVWLSLGTYLIKGRVGISNAVRFEGDIGATVLIDRGSNYDAAFRTFGTVSSVVFSGVTVTQAMTGLTPASGANTVDRMFWFDSANAVTFDNCTLDGGGWNMIFVTGTNTQFTFSKNKVGWKGTGTAYDNSSLYADIGNATITGNKFNTSDTNAVAAMEIHGGIATITGNATDGFGFGVNRVTSDIVGAPANAGPSDITGNTFNKARVGVALYSYSTNDLLDTVVSANSIKLANAYWSTNSSSKFTAGVTLYPDTSVTGRMDNVSISGNLIAFDPDVATDLSSIPYLISGVSATYYGVQSNLTISGNMILNSPASGVTYKPQLAASRNTTILGNTITDPGWNTNVTAKYRTGVYLGESANQVDVAENHIKVLLSGATYSIYTEAAGANINVVNNPIVGGSNYLGSGTVISTSNERLGVGTSVPAYKIVASGSGSDVRLGLVNTGVSGKNWYLQSASDGKLYMGPGSDSYIFDSGSLGIGVTPAAPLHVKLSGGEIRAQTTGSGSGWITFYTSGGARSGYFQADTGSGYADLDFAGPGNLNLTGGNVGINVTSPNAKLDVSGGAFVQSLTITNSTYPSDSEITNGQAAGRFVYGGTPTNQHTLFFDLYQVNRSVVLAQSVVLGDTTVTNFNTSATSNTVIYTIKMAANYPTVGKVIEPQLDGVFWQNGNNATFSTIQAWHNTTNLLLTVPMLANAAATAGPWQLNFRFTVRTNALAANSMAFMGKCLETQSATSGGLASAGIDSIVNPVVFDPTINNTITITVSNNVNAGGNCSYRLQEGRTVCIDSVPKLPGEL